MFRSNVEDGVINAFQQHYMAMAVQVHNITS